MATVLRNVRVFDGEAVSSATAVVIDGQSIVEGPGSPADEVVDGGGAMVLPGLIDTHVHAKQRQQLEAAAAAGVTTLLDMGSNDLEVLASLQNLPGLPTLLSAGHSASGPGSQFIEKMGMPVSSGVDGPADAERFVTERKAEGSDYIKILIEDPKFPGAKPLAAATVTALAAAARAAGLLTIAHVVSATTLRVALEARVDIVTHAALGGELDAATQALISRNGTAIIPTLGMMHGVVETIGGKPLMKIVGAIVPAARMKYRFAEATVRSFHRAGSTVLAGTDANNDHGAPYHPSFGEGLHDELERMVNAGLAPSEALAGATSKAADTFGLTDRGRIAAGLRADLMLVDGDPTTAIAATRRIRGVWIAGERVAGAP